MLGKLLTTDVEGIKSIGAVGSMLEQVLFRLGLLLHRLVLAEAQPAPLYPSRLDCQYEIVVVLTIEERHEALLTSEALIDEQVLLIVAHRVAQVHILYLPPVALKFMDDDVAEVLVIHGIVRAEGRGVVVEDNRLVLMISVVRAEIIDQGGNLTLELDVEGFENIQAGARWLAGYNPVDIGIVVHADANRGQGIHILVGAAVKLRAEGAELRSCFDVVVLKARLLQNLVVTELVEVRKVRGIILVVLLHRGVEFYSSNA